MPEETSDRSAPPAAVPEATLAALVHDLADAIVVADPTGAIIVWNDAATRLFGWPADEALARSLDLIIPERFRARHWTGYEQVMATGETRYGAELLQVPAVHRDGHRLSIAFTVTLLRRPGRSEPVGIAAVIRDETERRAEVEELREELRSLRGDGA